MTVAKTNDYVEKYVSRPLFTYGVSHNKRAMDAHSLNISCQLPIVPVPGQSAGLMVPRGIGRHPRRVIPVYDLLFVREGVLHIQEEELEFAVQAGETLLLWPHRLHWGTRDFTKDLRYFWMEFTVPEDSGEKPAAPPDSLICLQQHTRVSQPAFLTELFLLYTNALESRDNPGLLSPLMAGLILNEIANPALAKDTNPRDSVSVLAGRANTYIRTNYREDITPVQVAGAIDCSYQHLSRIYRRVYNKTLNQAIREARIGYACHLLIETNLSINQVATACGFTDYRYFYRLFRLQKRMTATEYRSLYARTFINTE